MLELPVVMLISALLPTPVLAPPVVLWNRADVPLAVLSLPVVLRVSAKAPLAVFSSPVVLKKERGLTVGGVARACGITKRVYAPLAVLLNADGIAYRALKAPLAVLS